MLEMSLYRGLHMILERRDTKLWPIFGCITMSLLPWRVDPTKHHCCSCWHTNYSILVGMNNITTFFLPWPISKTNLLQRMGGFCCCNSPRSVSSPAVMFLMLLLLLSLSFQCAHKNRVHLSVVCLPFLQPPLHTCGWGSSLHYSCSLQQQLPYYLGSFNTNSIYFQKMLK
jgi:hypothetical protein